MMKDATIPELKIGSSALPRKTSAVKCGLAFGPRGPSLAAALPLKIEIEGLRLLSPTQIRELLTCRRSIEEVKMLIEEEADPTFIYQGDLSLDGKDFRLVDLYYGYQETETVLRANVAEIGGRGEIRSSEMMGHVVGRIETREKPLGAGGEGLGNLVIKEGALRGRYRIRLDTPPKEGSL